MINVDDLEEDIQLFSVRSTAPPCQLIGSYSAVNYDLLRQWSLGYAMADINTFHNSDKI
jgi:hypothetical protein